MPNCTNIYDDNNSTIENDKIKSSLDKLLKIIDVGFDKSIYDFNKEINIIAKKILSSITTTKSGNTKNEDNIMQNDFYLPINSMRNYLKPNYVEFKTLYKDDNNGEESNDIVNIFDSYINNFTTIVNKFFKFFLTTSKDNIIEKNLQTMRKNFFQTFRINILLFEEESTINDLI